MGDTPQQLEWSVTLLDGKDVTLAEAEAAVAALGDGWRMPTVEELQTILDRSRYYPAVDEQRLHDTKSEPYWTSTWANWSANVHWVVGIGIGVVISSGSACVRACRVIDQGVKSNSKEGKVVISRERAAKIQAIVNEQAEDEGLWFIAETITEDYLQKALRKLHEAVEESPPGDFQLVAKFMLDHGFTTGTAESISDLLGELSKQIFELRQGAK